MTAQDLKNSILQLAVQGKLVPQDPNDEPASELLKRICAEKAKLGIKEKSLREIMGDEILFDIPESWIWLKLGDICQAYNGNSINANVKQEKYSKKCNGYSFIATKDVGFDHIIDYENGIYIPKEESKFKVAKCGSILLCMEGGSAGKKIGIIDRDVCFGNKLCCFTPYVIDNYYIYYYLQSPAFFSAFFGSMTGLIGGVGSAKLKNLACPIPPLAEQERIVARIEELMPMVEEYGKAQEQLATLNAEFPDKLRKSILQQAVQGKLTERDSADEPASELLKRIKAEKEKLIKDGKIKKEKPLPEITDDEKPFDIPESWKWVKLGSVINLLSGTDFAPEEYNDAGKGTVYITGASCLTDNGVFKNRWTETPRVIAEQGDVLLVCKGSGYGKTVICDIESAHIARQIMAIKYTKLLDMRYIRFFIMSNLTLIKQKGQGVIPGIDRGSVLNMSFPLPPLAEQKRIVARVEELLKICDEMR